MESTLGLFGGYEYNKHDSKHMVKYTVSEFDPEFEQELIKNIFGINEELPGSGKEKMTKGITKKTRQDKKKKTLKKRKR